MPFPFRLDKPPSRAKWDRQLGDALVLSDKGAAKYAQTFGLPLSRMLLARWIQKGYIRRAAGAAHGKPSVLFEADLAYCAETHAWRQAVGIAKTVPLLAADGTPALPAHQTPAEAQAEYRRRLARGIRLRPRKGKPKGKSSPARSLRSTRKKP